MLSQLIALILGAAASSASPLRPSSNPATPILPRGAPDPPGFCGVYATAGNDVIYMMANAISGWEGHRRVKPYTCERFKCRNTAGVYVCNDNAEPQDIEYADVSKIASKLETGCGNFWNTHPLSGEAFMPKWNSSVIVAYANCAHSRFRRPETYRTPGPNGPPAAVYGVGPEVPRPPYDISESAVNGAPQPWPTNLLKHPPQAG